MRGCCHLQVRHSVDDWHDGGDEGDDHDDDGKFRASIGIRT